MLGSWPSGERRTVKPADDSPLAVCLTRLGCLGSVSALGLTPYVGTEACRRKT
jgi:hypothetical protein